MNLDFIFQIAILIFSVVIHEVSHGYAAYWLGDSTAKYQGRLNLNPLRHLDPFGSVVFPLLLYISNAGFLLGWAKPVPYNPYNLRNQRWGDAIVAAAGPLSNIAIALIFGLLLRFSYSLGLLSVSNSGVFEITTYIVYINLLLAIFNLVPIPPLDGSKILFSALKIGWDKKRLFFEQFGIVLVVGFMFFLSPVISYIVSTLFSLITGFYF